MSGTEHWESFVQQYPDLFIICADTMPFQLDLLNRGYVNGLVGQSPYDMGIQSIDTLLALSKDKEVKDFIATSMVVMGRVNQDNPYQFDLANSATGSTSSGRFVIMMILIMSALLILLEASPTDATPIEATKVDVAATVEDVPDTAQAHNQDITMFSNKAVSEEYTFAIIPKSTNSVFFDPVKDGCEARAAALSRVSIRGGISIKCIFVGPQSEEHFEEQGVIALDLINSGSVDGISFAVMNPEIAATIVDSAVAANIPIITFDSDAPDTDRSAYVGTDNIALGEEIAMVLLSRFATSGNYAILSIDGNVAPNVFIRATGVRNKLNEHGWNEAVGSPLLVSPEVSKETFDLLHDHMAKHPDTDAILVTWGKLLQPSLSRVELHMIY